MWHLHAHLFHNVRKTQLPSRAPPDSHWVTWPLCPHTCQFCCFLFSFSLCTRVRLGTVSSCSVFCPHARPFERCSFLSVASGPTSPGPQNGQPRAGAGNSHHRPHLAHPTAACGCSVPPCPGQHLSLPFPMTRWFWILAAARGGKEQRNELWVGSMVCVGLGGSVVAAENTRSRLWSGK